MGVKYKKTKIDPVLNQVKPSTTCHQLSKALGGDRKLKIINITTK